MNKKLLKNLLKNLKKLCENCTNDKLMTKENLNHYMQIAIDSILTFLD